MWRDPLLQIQGAPAGPFHHVSVGKGWLGQKDTLYKGWG